MNSRDASNELRVELKYCERCGILCVRESGGGQVYCGSCLLELAELPPPRLARSSPQLPVGRPTFVDDDELDFSDLNELDMQSSGGAA